MRVRRQAGGTVVASMNAALGTFSGQLAHCALTGASTAAGAAATGAALGLAFTGAGLGDALVFAAIFAYRGKGGGAAEEGGG